MNGMLVPSVYIPRLAAERLVEAAAVQPAVILMGARQTGKSTLVRHLYPDRAYLTLDALSVRAQAESDPDGLVRGAQPVIIDEVQRVPALAIAIKAAIDAQGRMPGRFVITGSANLLSMGRVTESLAGRATYTTLWPLTRRERLGLGSAGCWSDLAADSPAAWPDLLAAQEAPREDWRLLVRRSAYPTPALHLHTLEQHVLWLEGYLDTYADRDVRDVVSVERPLDLRRLMRAACLSVAQIENQASWGRAIGLPRNTVSRYLDLLEKTYQLIRVPGYAGGSVQRLARSSKVFWSDTAMALHLAETAEPSGFHLENLVLGDLVAWRDRLVRRPALHHWRSGDRHEVDFVVELERGQLLAIEIKAQARPEWRDVPGLHAFRDAYGPRVQGALVLHGGDEIYVVGDGIVAAPWWRVI